MRLFALLLPLLLSQPILAQPLIAWSQTEDIAPSQFGNLHPRVTVDGSGNPMVIWGNGTQVNFARMGGNGFAAPTVLNPESIPIFAASWAGPDLASHGDTVYVVFKETPEHTGGIYIVHSFDGGLNFSIPERVDDTADSLSRFPAVATDANGNPMVAFMKFNPGWGSARYVMAKSEDYGNTFGIDVLGSRFSGGDVCDCCPASIAVSGSTAALLYRDNLNNLRNSWAGISLNSGNSFVGGIEIDNTDWMVNACPSSGPDGVIYGDKLYSVFMSAASGKVLCYRSRASINNLQLESIEPLTANIMGLNLQNFPRIAGFDKAAAILWTQRVNDNAQLAIQFTNNISNGFPSGYDILVEDNVMNADVAISSTEVYVVWEDMDSGTVKFKSGTYILSGLSDLTSQHESVKLYPNPASSLGLSIQFEQHDDSQVHYTIFNSQGKHLVSGFGYAIDGVLNLDTSNLSAGVYFIQINHHNQIDYKPLIFQND